MFVELTNPANPSKTKFTVGNFYRPPHETVAQLKLFINGDVLTFLGVLMYCIVYVLLHCDTCVIMLSYLYLPYYDYG